MHSIIMYTTLLIWFIYMYETQTVVMAVVGSNPNCYQTLAWLKTFLTLHSWNEASGINEFNMSSRHWICYKPCVRVRVHVHVVESCSNKTGHPCIHIKLNCDRRIQMKSFLGGHSMKSFCRKRMKKHPLVSTRSPVPIWRPKSNRIIIYDVNFKLSLMKTMHHSLQPRSTTPISFKSGRFQSGKKNLNGRKSVANQWRRSRVTPRLSSQITWNQLWYLQKKCSQRWNHCTATPSAACQDESPSKMKLLEFRMNQAVTQMFTCKTALLENLKHAILFLHTQSTKLPLPPEQRNKISPATRDNSLNSTVLSGIEILQRTDQVSPHRAVSSHKLWSNLMKPSGINCYFLITVDGATEHRYVHCYKLHIMYTAHCLITASRGALVFLQ